MPISPSQLIYTKRTKAKGMGVFAARDIESGEVVEVCPMLIIPEETLYSPSGTSPLKDYVFTWSTNQVGLALGFGSLYNHSYTPNLRSEDTTARVKRYIALRKISKNEELTHNYAGHPRSRKSVGFEVAKQTD